MSARHRKICSASLGAAILTIALPFCVSAMDNHVVQSPDTLKWGPAPPALPKGSEIAVLSGDPGKEGMPFVIRARMPAGYRIAPHTHPTDEHVTVISGTFNIGMGEKFDEAKSAAVKAGGFAVAQKGMAHYAWFSEPTVIQVHGVGPFGITYVNPADDPRKSN